METELKRKNVCLAFMRFRVKLGKLFFMLMSQSIKPEDVPEEISKIVSSLSSDLNEYLQLKDVSLSIERNSYCKRKLQSLRLRERHSIHFPHGKPLFG